MPPIVILLSSGYSSLVIVAEQSALCRGRLQPGSGSSGWRYFFLRTRFVFVIVPPALAAICCLSINEEAGTGDSVSSY
jgi:hypothetical protein